MSFNNATDVLCIGHASYDLVFSVDHHPGEDEKVFADDLLGCGGGPAANAAVTVARLGFNAAFAGYLGNDVYGDSHHRELQKDSVDTRLIVRGSSPTPLSVVLVKPDGRRALLNYKGQTQALPASSIDFTGISAKAVLFDGHEPRIAMDLLNHLRHNPVPTILDAGSVHGGTLALLDKATYLVCSEKFARQYAGDEQSCLSQLATIAPFVVITLGERGLIWQCGLERGQLLAPPVTAIDTTGAGDAFHGAFAAALVAGLDWQETLRYASVAGAFCCTQMGARTGLPNHRQHQALLKQWQN